MELSENEISDLIIKYFLKHGIIVDDSNCYGASILTVAYESGLPVTNLFTKILGFKKCSIDFLKIFKDLIIIGDGECPSCGADTEPIIGENSRTIQIDLDSEPYESDEYKQCININCKLKIN